MDVLFKKSKVNCVLLLMACFTQFTFDFLNIYLNYSLHHFLYMVSFHLYITVFMSYFSFTSLNPNIQWCD